MDSISLSGKWDLDVQSSYVPVSRPEANGEMMSDDGVGPWTLWKVSIDFRQEVKQAIMVLLEVADCILIGGYQPTKLNDIHPSGQQFS